MESCPYCALLSTESADWLVASDHWSAIASPLLDEPGWVVVMTRRHANGFDHAAPDVLADFGPILGRVSAAVRAATGAERVYVIHFGEVVEHLHVLLAPRTPDLPVDRRGAALIARRAEARDALGAAQTCQRIRDALEVAL